MLSQDVLVTKVGAQTAQCSEVFPGNQVSFCTKSVQTFMPNDNTMHVSTFHALCLEWASGKRGLETLIAQPLVQSKVKK